MLTLSDKQGGGNFKTHEADILREAIRECNFIDLGNIGHDYTWSNNQGGDQNLQEGLDRFFANEEWKERFPGAYVTYLDKRKGGVWQVDVLKELFSEEEVKEIMKIPLPKFDTRDVWAWNQTKDGEYSVKSAYHVALKQKREAQPSTSSMEQERVWKELLRNWVDFEQKRRQHIDMIHKAVSLIGEYSKAQGKPTNGNNGVGFGAVVRDYDGDVVVAACKKKEGEYAVDVAEAMAMRFGLQIAIEAGFHKFILEVDNLKLFHHRWVMVKPLSSELL
ncbi:Ephrin receptor 1 [Bienertia sinuspersici]